MKKKLCYLFLLLSFVTNCLFSQETNIVPGEIIIMLRSELDVSHLCYDLKNVNDATTGFKLQRTLSQSMHIYLFKFNSNGINQNKMLNAIRSNRHVVLAQFNHILEERNTPNDPKFGLQWNMENTGQNGGVFGADIGAVKAWDLSTGGLTATGDTIVVAVIDGGFDITHKDLSFWKNYQEIPNNNIDDDNNGYIDDFDGWRPKTSNDSLIKLTHGTHVSGIVGAKGNNCKGVTGVNWNVKIMPICTDGLIESEVVAAYAYVRDQRKLYNQTNGAKGAFVVASNSSFGFDLAQPSSYPLWCAFYDSLGSVGILNAAATANANNNVDAVGDIPSACPSNWLVTVTNTNDKDEKSSNAGYGLTMIDLGAPGTNIFSTGISDTYTSSSGTSMATPHVTGAIALMYSVACPQFMIDCKSNPATTASLVKNLLLAGVDKIPSLNGKTVSGGRLNLYNSVQSIQNHYFNSICPISIASDTCLADNINEISQSNTAFGILNVYPNPANDFLNIVYQGVDNVKISIVNTLGQEVLRAQDENTVKGINTFSVDINSIEPGIYFLSLYSDNKRSNVVKVLVQ